MRELFEFRAIGVVQSPFKDKFGIPRQPGLASAAKGIIKIDRDPDLKTALRSLEEFSHLWIVFVFHDHGGKKWKPSIRPPRLGGARKVGVLASRSPHRPNPIGLSAVAIEKIDFEAVGGPEIHVSGIDLLDGTPVLDLKPYIPYADLIPHATAGWAEAPIDRVAISFSAEAERGFATFALQGQIPTGSALRDLITEILELDPRPAFQKRQLAASDLASDGLDFGIQVLGFEVKYQIKDRGFTVTSISTGPLKKTK